MQSLQEFVMERGLKPSAKLLGVTPEYIGRQVRSSKVILVERRGRRFQAIDIGILGRKHHTSKADRRNAIRIAEALLGREWPKVAVPARKKVDAKKASA